MARYQRGERTRLPFRVQVHLVAARYGTTPEAVRAWPAGDFRDALSFLAITGGHDR